MGDKTGGQRWRVRLSWLFPCHDGELPPVPAQHTLGVDPERVLGEMVEELLVCLCLSVICAHLLKVEMAGPRVFGQHGLG